MTLASSVATCAVGRAAPASDVSAGGSDVSEDAGGAGVGGSSLKARGAYMNQGVGRPVEMILLLRVAGRRSYRRFVSRATKPVKESAGLVLYRSSQSGHTEVLLGHPGGPFWAAKDEGAWSLPKGEIDEGEDLLLAARRETEEETGARPEGPFASLGSVRQKSGKIVHAWAVRHDADTRIQGSSIVEMEWPPRSGHRISFPEIDRAEYFEIERARTKINAAQAEFLDRLLLLLREQ